MTLEHQTWVQDKERSWQTKFAANSYRWTILNKHSIQLATNAFLIKVDATKRKKQLGQRLHKGKLAMLGLTMLASWFSAYMGFFLRSEQILHWSKSIITAKWLSTYVLSQCPSCQQPFLFATHYLFRLLGNDSYLLWRTEKNLNMFENVCER